MTTPKTTVADILDELCKHTQVDYGYAKLVPSETNKALTQIEELLDRELPESFEPEMDSTGSKYITDTKDGYNQALDDVRKTLKKLMGNTGDMV